MTYKSYWEAECIRLRAEINKLEQIISGRVGAGNEAGVPVDTIAKPCPEVKPPDWYDVPQSVLDEAEELQKGE